jgi:DNA polymerase-3 subunit delta
LKLTGAAARRFLDKPDANAALLFGPNRSMVADAAKTLVDFALKGSDDPFALSRLAEDELRKDRSLLGDALAAQSLLGGPRVAWVRIDGSGADDQILWALAEIEAGKPGAFLIVEGGDLGTASKLAKAFEAAARAVSIAFYDESASDRASFVRSLLEGERIALAPDATALLSERLPGDRALVRREIEKLAAFSYGATASPTFADIDSLLPGEDDAALDEAVDAAIHGRGAAAQEALARMDVLNGVTAIKAMQRRLLRLLEARSLMEQGLSPSEAAAKLRPPVFWKERDRFQALLGVWSARGLMRALDIVWSAELAAKQAQSPQAMLAADAFAKVAAFAGR